MQKNPTSGGFSRRALSWLVPFLAVSAAYLYAFPQPTIFYAGVVLLHAAAGLLATLLLLRALFRLLRSGSFSSRAGWFLIALGAIVGVVLIKTGTSRAEWNKLYLHIVVSLAGVGLLLADWLSRKGASQASVETRPAQSGAIFAAMRVALCFVVLAGLGYGAQYLRDTWQTRNRIENPAMPPDSMNGEGDGPEGSFFPSSASDEANPATRDERAAGTGPWSAGATTCWRPRAPSHVLPTSVSRHHASSPPSRLGRSSTSSRRSPGSTT